MQAGRVRREQRLQLPHAFQRIGPTPGDTNDGSAAADASRPVSKYPSREWQAWASPVSAPLRSTRTLRQRAHAADPRPCVRLTAGGAGLARALCRPALPHPTRRRDAACGTLPPPPYQSPRRRARRLARAGTRLPPAQTRASRVRTACPQPSPLWRPWAGDSTQGARRRAGLRRRAESALGHRVKDVRVWRECRSRRRRFCLASMRLGVMPSRRRMLDVGGAGTGITDTVSTSAAVSLHAKAPAPDKAGRKATTSVRYSPTALAARVPSLCRGNLERPTRMSWASYAMDTVNVPTDSWLAAGSYANQGRASEHTSALGSAHAPSHRTHGASGMTSLHALGLSAVSSKMIKRLTP
eukprot:6193609-Pleurochrysis_carterae.AAC.1